jgi:hypothetical protein
MKDTTFNFSIGGSEDRGQSNLDFSIALLIYISFISATFFLGGSPLVDQSSAAVDLKTEAETALVQVEQEALMNDAGQYDEGEIESFTASGSVTTYADIPSDLNANVVFASTPRSINTDHQSSLLASDSDNKKRVGDEKPKVGVTQSTTTIYLDGRPVRVTVNVWRKQ